jgi:hypothetical protein
MPFSGIVLNLLLAFGQFPVLGDDNLVAGERSHLAGFLGDDDCPGVAGNALLEAGGDQRRFGDQQRHRLPLHVGAHQRAVGVIVLEERNQAGSNGDELLGRNIHVIDPGWLDVNEVAFSPAHYAVGGEFALIVKWRVGLGDDECFLAVGREVINALADACHYRLCDRAFPGNRNR